MVLGTALTTCVIKILCRKYFSIRMNESIKHCYQNHLDVRTTSLRHKNEATWA